MTSEKTKSGHDALHPSDAPLQGAEALDLYLSEIGRNIAAISEQSALLLAELNVQVTLLHEIGAGPARSCAPTGDRQETEPEHEAGDVPGAKPK